jgi:YidC/Oxa1 family membrane protein insertase
MFSNIYNTILSQPLFNLLVFFYNILWSDIGLAIIAVTVIIRLILYPSFQHQLKSQKRLQQLQPKMQEIKAKYKDSPEQQSRAMMELYKSEGVNPLGSCLPIIVQLIVLIALYRVFLTGLNGEALQNLYSFITNPGTIEPISFGFLDLSEKNIWLAAVTGIVQFIQSKLMASLQPKPKPGGGDDKAAMMSSMMTKQFLYVFPILTVVIGAQLPAGLVLYWLVTTLFSVGQHLIVMREPKTDSVIPV